MRSDNKIKNQIKMNWNDISIDKYEELLSVFNEQYEDDIDKAAAMISVIFDVDAMHIPFALFQQYSNELQFLGQPMPKTKAKPYYTVNGHEYWLLMDYVDFTTAQYVDYINFGKANDYVGMLSVVLVPKGHQYMDGYDIGEVRKDLGSMSVVDGMGVVSFFGKSSVNCIQYMLRYLNKKLTRKKMKLTKAEKEEIRNQMKQLEVLIGELSHIL